MSYLTGNTLATLKMGDFYYKGFGNLQEDPEKSKQYYKESKGAELIADAFKLSNANFNLGMLHLFKENSSENQTYNIINPRFKNQTILKGIKIDSETFVFVSTSLMPLDSSIKILKPKSVYNFIALKLPG